MGIEGSGITYKAWALPSPRAAFLLIHGLGANSSWWEPLASAFLKNNLSSYAIDLRNSRSFAGFFHSVNSLRTAIGKEHPGKKVFVIGESMGALVALSMELKNKTLFDGIACISPAFKSKTKLNFIDYLKIFLPIFYNPERPYDLHLSPNMCTRDTDYIKAIEADYNKDALSTSRILFDLFLAQVSMRFSRERFDIPILFLLAGDDKLVDSEVSKKIFGKLKCDDKTLLEYPGMYHSLSIEIGKEKVFQDILDWANGRI